MTVPIMRRHHQFDDDGVYEDESQDFDSDELMLQHETEQDVDVDTVNVPPLKAVLVDAVVNSPIVPQHVQCFTVVLTADDPIMQLLAHDPLRTNAEIVSLDQNIVLCHSFTQANDPANQVSTLLRPSGAVIPASGTYPFFFNVDTTAAVWVVGNTYPSRVSVVVKRRSG